jgi:hypothetical protein
MKYYTITESWDKFQEFIKLEITGKKDFGSIWVSEYEQMTGSITVCFSSEEAEEIVKRAYPEMECENTIDFLSVRKFAFFGDPTLFPVELM